MKIKINKTTLLLALMLFTTPLSSSVAVASDLSQTSINAPTQNIDVNEASIAYRVIGQGEPILMMNRFRGDMNHWDPIFIDKLAQTRKVILFDYTGMGVNDGMPKATMDEIVDDVILFMDAMNLQKVDAVGWSLGTSIALSATTKYPKRFAQMVMLGAIAAGGMQQAYVTPDIAEFARRAQKPQLTVDDFVYILFGDTEESKTKGIQTLKRRALWQTPGLDIPLVPPEKWKRHFKVIGVYQNNPETIKNLDVKNQVLFINGDRDHIAPPRIAAEWIQHIPNSQLSVINSSGHNVHGQNPETVSALTLKFLEQ